jgi:phosphoribosyl-ATP pyrophosphohydrolase
MSNKIIVLARKLMDESEYYYQLKKQGNSPEYIFEKAQEEAEEIMMKEFVAKLKRENK